MKSKILDGKALSQKILLEAKEFVDQIKGDKPKLVVVQVGNNLASNSYIRTKKRACETVGVNFVHKVFEENIKEEELILEIEKLNIDKTVTGFIVQLPLPIHINESKIIAKIDYKKDVDGFSEFILGKVVLGDISVAPATPKGIIRMLDEYNIDLIGKNVVVIGRSNIVGKPLSIMLINKQATVTVCNSRTKDLKTFVQNADIVIVAIGKANFITKEFVRKGQVIIDVGANHVDGVYCGDVNFKEVSEIVDYISPVPGGVGPMTVATLIDNLINVYKKNTAL